MPLHQDLHTAVVYTEEQKHKAQWRMHSCDCHLPEIVWTVKFSERGWKLNTEVMGNACVRACEANAQRSCVLNYLEFLSHSSRVFNSHFH